MNKFHIPHEVRQAIDSALNYVWDDEEVDYLASDKGRQRGHIFNELKTIKCWMMHLKNVLDNSFHTVARRANTSVQNRRKLPEIPSEVVFAVYDCMFATEWRYRSN